MGMENSGALQMIAQLQAQGINVFAKHVDLIELYLNNGQTELEKYAADGVGHDRSVVKVNVPTEDLFKLQTMLMEENIPSTINLTKDVECLVRSGIIAKNVGPISDLYIRDIDLDVVQEHIRALNEEREKIREFEDRQISENMFEGMKTSFIDHLSPVQSEIIASELERYGVNFKRSDDLSCIEIEASMFNRLYPDQLSRAERALHDATIKSLSSEYLKVVDYNLSQKAIIDQILDNKIDGHCTIFDSAEPNVRIDVYQRTCEITDNGNFRHTYKIETEENKQAMLDMIKQMKAPSIAETSEYIKAIDHNDIDFIKKDELIKRRDLFMEDHANKVCEEIQKDKLINVSFQDIAGKDHKSVEIIIPNTDILFQKVLDISPSIDQRCEALINDKTDTIIKDIGNVEDLSLLEQTRNEVKKAVYESGQKEINDELELKFTSLEVTPAEMHTPELSKEHFKASKLIDNAEKDFDPSYDRDHDHKFDPSEYDDQDHDGTSDELEYGDSFDDDPFADFN